jgi:UDP-N-acetylmuramoylalanine--D-glutamate ligase
MSVPDIPLLGKHNQANILAAALTACLFSLPTEGIGASIRGFQALEHRLEKVTTLDGVEIYNDSKATNVDATLKSIQSFTQPLVLILGGKDKGGNFRLLRDAVKSRVKHLVLVGDARETIRQALKDTAPFEMAESFEGAVRRAMAAAAPGDVVLLAPACTSFDMFQSFGHRGRVFKEIVFSLAKTDREKVS